MPVKVVNWAGGSQGLVWLLRLISDRSEIRLSENALNGYQFGGTNNLSGWNMSHAADAFSQHSSMLIGEYRLVIILAVPWRANLEQMLKIGA